MSITSLRDVTIFFRVWYGTGLASVVIPLFIFTVARLSNPQQEEEQEQQQQQQNNYYNQYNNNNCRWYQWRCKNNNNYNYNNNNQQQDGGGGSNDEENSAPWWWFGGEEDRRREEQGRPSFGLVFVYVWSLALFGLILYAGYDGVTNGRHVSVMAVLIMFANLCFLMCILLQNAEGLVQVDGPELEERGFYGQFGVLLYMTFAAWLLFSVVLCIFIKKRASGYGVTKIEIDSSDYQIHQPSSQQQGGSRASSTSTSRNTSTDAVV